MDASYALARFLADSGHDSLEVEEIVAREYPAVNAAAVAAQALARREAPAVAGVPTA